MKIRVALLAVCQAALVAADLPVREVVLYKHGVAYFQRSGSAAAGETVRLEFQAEQMDDVLKSLTIEQVGGGNVAGVRYDSATAPESRIAEFPFFPGKPSPALADLLDQLRGARIELQTAGEKISGSILSARVVAPGDTRPASEQVVLLLENGEIRTFDLAAVRSVSFTDPELQTRLRKYLEILNTSRSRQKRSVYIDAAAGAQRRIRVGYMLPSPVWKSSYRLILGTGSTLEGWGIVDNTTGEDWNQVSLSLVSGRPISFLSNLYEPRFLARPTAELPEETAAAPVVHQGGVIGGMPGAAPSPGPPPPPQFRAKAAMDLAESVAVAPSSVTPQTSAADLGELFEYRFTQPVTVKAGESAMLPFLQQKIEARKLLIYTDPSSVHPLNAAEIVNQTGKTLDGGPITVYDGGYAGEALVETVKTGDRRLISYAVDLGTRVTSRFETGGQVVREIHASNGVLRQRLAVQETRTYSIKNVDAKPKTLLIEQASRPGFRLVSPKPVETTANAYRFEVKLGSASEARLVVVEERELENTLSISSLTPNALLAFAQNKTISAAARQQLEQAQQLKRKIVETDSSLAQTRRQITDMTNDQQRLRQNLISLNQVSNQQEQVQKYARTLGEQESKLVALRDREAELVRQKSALESELNSLIEKLEF